MKFDVPPFLQIIRIAIKFDGSFRAWWLKDFSYLFGFCFFNGVNIRKFSSSVFSLNNFISERQVFSFNLLRYFFRLLSLHFRLLQSKTKLGFALLNIGRLLIVNYWLRCIRQRNREHLCSHVVR
jgi:hypothetical protein